MTVQIAFFKRILNVEEEEEEDKKGTKQCSHFNFAQSHVLDFFFDIPLRFQFQLKNAKQKRTAEKKFPFSFRFMGA
jgi:hypothetical protein